MRTWVMRRWDNGVYPIPEGPELLKAESVAVIELEPVLDLVERFVRMPANLETRDNILALLKAHNRLASEGSTE